MLKNWKDSKVYEQNVPTWSKFGVQMYLLRLYEKYGVEFKQKNKWAIQSNKYDLESN